MIIIGMSPAASCEVIVKILPVAVDFSSELNTLFVRLHLATLQEHLRPMFGRGMEEDACEMWAMPKDVVGRTTDEYGSTLVGQLVDDTTLGGVDRLAAHGSLMERILHPEGCREPGTQRGRGTLIVSGEDMLGEPESTGGFGEHLLVIIGQTEFFGQSPTDLAASRAELTAHNHYGIRG